MRKDPENETHRPSFPLNTQGCIPGLTKNGRKAVSRSLSEVFLHAEEDLAITHPSPGTVVACYELLLAICHAAGLTPEDAEEWREWVENRRPLTPVVEWLSDPVNRRRFDLFDPEHPFGQNALLAEHLDEHGYSPVQLVLERAKDYNQFADHVHLHDPAPMKARDAFLAMITQHCYGLGGRVMAPVKLFGKPFTYGSVARLGTRVRVLAVGDSVADTLRLNLCLSRSTGTLNTTWTGNPRRRTFTSTRETRRLDGPADWHSALGRSILLRPRHTPGTPPDEVVVDRVLLGAGETVTVDNVADHDAVYIGSRHLQASLSRALWRDAHAIYGASLDPGRNPNLFTLIAGLDRPVKLLAVGLDAVNTKVAGWVRDVFPYNPLHGGALLTAAKDGALLADEAVQSVRRAAAVACRYAYPGRSRENTKTLMGRFDASDEVWARAGAPFHHLLEAVADGSDAVEALRGYAATMRAVATDALDERLRPLPPNTRGWRAAVQARDELRRQLATKHTFAMYPEITHATT
ncbi:type I-E CRISPR-associated protein Cse1/CasA [Streptosporangium sp. NPDC051022]|uniref:type I-E CRISPR-associated protein Cse1/CasA n=1 Tax=Streptosporangium sp. NPDC051022 TaxID=3155752 RepID=UPI003412C1D5